MEEVGQHRALIDDLECQIPGDLYPDAHALSQIQHCQRTLTLPVSLAPIIPGEKVPGKQHMRTRIGYRLHELPELDQRLADENVTLQRVLCQIDWDASPWKILSQAKGVSPLSHIHHIDWLVPLMTQSANAQILSLIHI